MVNRDILRDQIEQVGRVIGKAINIFFGFKKDGNVLLGIEEAKKELQSTIDLDIDGLVKMSEQEINQFFSESLYTGDQVEELAQFIYEIGTHLDDSLSYYQTALSLYQIAGTLSKTYSIDRAESEKMVKLKIDQLKSAKG